MAKVRFVAETVNSDCSFTLLEFNTLQINLDVKIICALFSLKFLNLIIGYDMRQFYLPFKIEYQLYFFFIDSVLC